MTIDPPKAERIKEYYLYFMYSLFEIIKFSTIQMTERSDFDYLSIVISHSFRLFRINEW